MSEQKPKDRWEKAQILSSILGSIAIPLVLLLVGDVLANSNREKEESAHSVQLAIEILRDKPPKGEEIPGLREWAFKTLNQNLQIPLPEEVGTELLARSLPGRVGKGPAICAQEVDSPCGSCKAAAGSFCCVTCGTEQDTNR